MDWPAAFNPVLQGLVIESKLRSPITQAHSLSVECEYPVAASVSGLLSASAPFAIAGLIVAVVIYPLQ